MTLAEALRGNDLLAGATTRFREGEIEPLRIGRSGREDAAVVKQGGLVGVQGAVRGRRLGDDRARTDVELLGNAVTVVAVGGRNTVVQDRQLEVAGGAAEAVHENVVGHSRLGGGRRNS